MSEQQLREELDAVYRSTSWRITAPLRFFMAGLKFLIYSIGSPKKSMIRVLRYLNQYRWIVSAATFVLDYFPGIKKRIRGHVFNFEPQASEFRQKPAKDSVALKRTANMSEASIQILSELEAALKNKK
ncbi:hypothetical protein [Undibacterium flavidum]|uniref:Uncharacterized protein n=1 Tax=Undibacterium flavidum TaxID=2762297 RepID=A0ABR6Y8Y3_9BURK|nr:hypothetical protein [Undibacterium flavidum]MBC3873070.1 hypothetical protein [Undibacterium flavidum]